MTPSIYIYFAFVPAVIFFLIWMTIKVMEASFHRYLYHKFLILIIAGAICFTAVIIIVIVSFFIGPPLS
ncbi:hypothetical protein [Spiroplasma eriocheiris]|uniref:Transmembrane protein n=1 Tax=Spiroplasma eriocheiris TaxID=315358 RepID=A0A0H3XGU0_9MOLU|nr:hypothetical protein [Spiroplasma eriocheiris]AHF57237.1 hypothetical protein SPE_0101 [Spiroplasma eriocheiris CCTCC M 207170]AKM53703.1 hypothetical protein SERIO_v1c01010 [Spiroplasma eriocheiris]